MSPLIHRIPRQFKHNLGKYLGIFLLIAFTVAFVSGYLTASVSITRLGQELPLKSNLEDGRVTVAHRLSDKQVEAAEEGEFSWFDQMSLAISGDNADLDDYENLTLYELFCRDIVTVVPDDPMVSDRDITMRVYPNRQQINLPSLHEGSFPQADNEIAIDTTFSRNHQLVPGDTIVVGDRELVISGLVTLPDYTTLFEKNTDFLMDDMTFCVGIMTPEGYASFSRYPETYTYGFLFDNPDLSLAQRTSGEANLVRALVLSGATVTDLIDIDSNQGVIFALDDAEGDATMYRVFFYIIIVIMAFIFVVITSATIEEESSVIGTLLASGYGKGELLRHYLVLPMVVAILAAIVGNLGQTFFIDWTQNAYYNSYSLPPFEIYHDPGVFVQTSILPIVLLFVITTIGLWRKLKYTPLAFLRHETSRGHRGRGIALPKSWPFFTRLRLRVLLNNVGSMITIFLGIFISGILLLMGIGMLPLVDNMAQEMAQSLPAEHVYTMRYETELPDEDMDVASQAEKVELASLEAPKKWNFGPIKVSVYGIQENSLYWPDLDVTDGKVIVGAGLAKKTGLAEGDTLLLTNPYEEEEYEVVIDGVCGTVGDMNVYMSRATLNDLLGNDADDFNGWVSDEALHFEENDVAADLTPDDMTKMADQMRESMGEIMGVMLMAAIIIFIVIIYLLSKTVMERSSRAVSQLKVFGYRDGELSRVYVRSITLCVIVSLLISIPIIQVALGGIIELALMNYDINFELAIPLRIYAEYVGIGFVSYLVVALLNRLHLKRVSLALALKSQE